MKRTVNKVAIFGVALASIMALGCDNFLFGSKSGGDSSTPTPELAQGFYNYPTGAENSRGTLKIKNTFADEVLVFDEEVQPAKYLATVASLGETAVGGLTDGTHLIKVVSKAAYIENAVKAGISSYLIVSSKVQAYALSVSALGGTYGGELLITNRTKHWVKVLKADGSGDTIAVASPECYEARIPISIDGALAYTPVFLKEYKFNGNVLGVYEISNKEGSDIITFNEGQISYQIELNLATADIKENINPLVRVINGSDKAVFVYLGNQKLTSLGANVETEAFASGNNLGYQISAGSSLSSISFDSPAWNERLYTAVTDQTENTMKANTVYEITLSGQKKNVITSYNIRSLIEDETVQEGSSSDESRAVITIPLPSNNEYVRGENGAYRSVGNRPSRTVSESVKTDANYFEVIFRKEIKPDGLSQNPKKYEFKRVTATKADAAIRIEVPVGTYDVAFLTGVRDKNGKNLILASGLSKDVVVVADTATVAIELWDTAFTLNIPTSISYETTFVPTLSYTPKSTSSNGYTTIATPVLFFEKPVVDFVVNKVKLTAESTNNSGAGTNWSENYKIPNAIESFFDKITGTFKITVKANVFGNSNTDRIGEWSSTSGAKDVEDWYLLCAEHESHSTASIKQLSNTPSGLNITITW